jgi:hypothetical protein
MRRISAGVTRFTWAMASDVAPYRGTYRLWTPRKARTEARSAAPAPSQVWPCTARRPSPSSSRAHSWPPWRTVAWAGWLPRSRCHASGDSHVLPVGRFSARRGRHVRVSAWSPTHKRCSPVSREMILMIGGRSLAEAPWPVRLLARRRGGSLGWRWGGPVFPRVLVPLLGRTGGASHHLCRGRRIEVGLATLPQGLPLRP